MSRILSKNPIDLNEKASIGCFGDPRERVEDKTEQCFIAGGGHTEYKGKHPDFIQSIRFAIRLICYSDDL